MFPLELPPYKPLTEQVKFFEFRGVRFEALWFIKETGIFFVTETDMMRFDEFSWVSYHDGAYLFFCADEKLWHDFVTEIT